MTIYWASRLGLVVLWLVAAAAAGRRGASEREPAWWVASGGCLFLASVRGLRWNWILLDAVRGGLRSADLYEDRIWLKALLLILIVVLAAWVARKTLAAWGRRGGSLGLCLTGVSLMMVITILETCSLDDLLPRPLFLLPGRYVLEYGLALLTGAGILWRRPVG